MFGEYSIHLANVADVLGCLFLVAMNMGWLDVIVAVVAGECPRNDVFQFPNFTHLDRHVAQVAFFAVKGKKPYALAL